MAQLFDVVRRAVTVSAVPDAMMAIYVLALSLGLIRILGLG